MATDHLIARAALIRQAAFDHIRRMQSRDLVLSHEEIARGFMFEGQRWPLGIPSGDLQAARYALPPEHPDLFPRKGGHVWYDDQRHVHQQIYAGEDELDYAFMGNDPSATDNISLRRMLTPDRIDLLPRRLPGRKCDLQPTDGSARL